MQHVDYNLVNNYYFNEEPIYLIHYIYLFFNNSILYPYILLEELNQSILGVNDSGAGGNSFN
ncbi:MAG: hypothetical protein ACKPKO_26340 [Candidatus Fonsibacter sp.]